MSQVIVTGGRDYADKDKVDLVLGMLYPGMLIQGGANGADALARDWASRFLADGSVTVKADWSKHGKAAGPIRNREMLDAYPRAIVVAFPGGKGTADCVKAARERGMLVLEVS